MHAPQTTPDLDLTAVVICRDDEERIGHQVRRLAAHLGSLGLASEILVVDELSGDNTLPLLGLLKREVPGVRVMAGVQPGQGFIRGAAEARGRAILLIDARTDAPLSAIGFALGRLERGWDATAVHGRYLLLRRSRTFHLFDALQHRRAPHDLEERFLRKARSLGLKVESAGGRLHRPTPWHRFRDTVLVPLASRAWW